MLLIILIVLVFVAVAYNKTSKNINLQNKPASDMVFATIKLSIELIFRSLSSIIKVSRALSGNSSIYDAVKDLNGSSSTNNSTTHSSNRSNQSQSVLQGKIQYCVTCENWDGSRQPGNVSQFVEYTNGSRGRCYLEKPHVQITYDAHHHCLNWQKWRALN